MKNKKRKTIFFIKLIIFFAIIFIIINLIPFILIYNSPFFFKKIFNRDLTFSKIKYLPHKLYLKIEEISLKNDNLELISIKKLIIDFDLIKLLQFKPTISYIEIDSPTTFFIKKNNQYSLPAFIELNKNKKSDGGKINLPFTIEHIVLKDGKINLFENNKFQNIAKEITIVLPGIKNIKEIEIEPTIYGKIFNKEFNIKGKSEFKENSLINTFFIDLKDFNLKDFSPLIPEIAGIKIVSGIANTKLNLIFKTYTNKKPELKIDGTLNVKNLNLYDTNSKKLFVENIDASGIIRIYDIFNNELNLDRLDLYSGTINLVFKEKDSSVFFKKKSNKNKTIFKFNVKEFSLANSKFNFYDGINNQNLNFDIADLKIKNFNTYQNEKFDFSINFNSKNLVEKIETKGDFNLKTLDLNLEEINIANIFIEKLLFVKNSFKNLDSLNIKNFSGKIFYSKNDIKVNGNGEINNFYIKIEGYKNKVGAEKINFALNEFNSNEKFFSFKYLEIYNGTIPIDKNEAVVKNIFFTLKDNKIRFIEKLNDKKEKIIFIDENININNIKANFVSENKNFESVINGVNFQIKIEINPSSSKILSSGNVSLESFNINTENKPVFKISNAYISVHRFEIFPIVVNINSIEANTPYIVIDIKKDKKLYLLSLNEISFKKQNGDIKLNIDSINFNNARILFTDYSLDEVFKIDLSNIQGKIKNFPSFVYPEGEIELTGVINNRNSFTIKSILSPIKIKGNFITNDLLVSQFSPYFNKYLGYKANSGIVNMEIPFEIKEDSLNAEVKLKLSNLRLTRVSSKKRADLSKVVTVMEDEKGNINLNIPIQGKWGNPNIDFREIFFNIFYDILDNSQKTFSNISQKDYKKDGTIEIIYFKGGSDEPTSNIDKLLSEEIKNKFNNPNKIFIIEGYVDKIKDAEYLKRKILLDKILLYNNTKPVEDSPEEFEVLKKIYFEIYQKELKEDISNKSLKEILISKIELTDSDYYSLSYARIKKVKEFLMTNYNIPEEKILIVESNIYENQYIKGVGNSLVVILSGDR